jgi:hypothetical protein
MPLDKDQQDTQAKPFTPVRQIPPVGPVTFTPAGRHRGEDPTDLNTDTDTDPDPDLDPDLDEDPTSDTVDDIPSAASPDMDGDAGEDTADDVAVSQSNGAVDRTAAVPTQREGKSDWQRVQASFVDDPRASVDAAANMVNEAVVAIQDRERQLRSTWEGNGSDTEKLRAAFRDYRALYDQLTGL